MIRRVQGGLTHFLFSSETRCLTEGRGGGSGGREVGGGEAEVGRMCKRSHVRGQKT